MKNDKEIKLTGAGIICYFDNRENIFESLKKDILFLVLEDFNGKYDLTKGTIDEDENSFSCAVRETFEESNLEIVDFATIDKQPININGNLDMFLGKIKVETMSNREDIIKLKINKKINSPEHRNYYFLSFDNAKNKMYNFLIPYLQEAVTIIS